VKNSQPKNSSGTDLSPKERQWMRRKLVVKEFVILGIEYYKPRSSESQAFQLILMNKRVLFFIFISARANKIYQVRCILQKAVSHQQKHTSPVKKRENISKGA
jgi:hypothetical protein